MQIATVQTRSRLMPVLVAGAFLLALAAGGMSLLKLHRAKTHVANVETGSITGSVSPAQLKGASGLPIPRFVSLKTEKVNVRKGPSSDHAVAWVYQAKGLPLEITAEFETWRRVRDAEGAEGWILQNLLTGKRTALISPGNKGKFVDMVSEPSFHSSTVAKLATGVMGEIKSCDGTWCRIVANGYDGYVDQNMIWGAYPGEALN